VRAHFRFLSGWLASVLAEGIRRGTIQAAYAPQVEAEIFMATVHGAMLSARAYGDGSMFGTIASAQLARYLSQS
jgi:TetR/AcrR family transcriptional repressor of nem operon